MSADQTNLLGQLLEENSDLRAENELLRDQLDAFYRPGWAQCTAAAATEDR